MICREEQGTENDGGESSLYLHCGLSGGVDRLPGFFEQHLECA